MTATRLAAFEALGRATRRTLLLAVAALVSACGGGGDDGPADASPDAGDVAVDTATDTTGDAAIDSSDDGAAQDTVDDAADGEPTDATDDDGDTGDVPVDTGDVSDTGRDDIDADSTDTAGTDGDTADTGRDTDATDDADHEDTDAAGDADAEDTGDSDAPDGDAGSAESCAPTAALAAIYPPEFSVTWSATGELAAFSSVRAADLNDDGILDPIVGHGFEGGTTVRGAGYVTAHDGCTGAQLWRVDGRDELMGSAALHDITGDGVPDVVIGGRNGDLLAVDGALGTKLWLFFEEMEPRESGYYNFYSPQFIHDVDGDGTPDLLASNGGDARRPPFSERDPGHIMIISGVDGSILSAPQTPDAAETYMSAVLYTRASDDTQIVVFGTGGETHAGSLWSVPLDDVIAGDISDATQLTEPTTTKGVIAPPALADLNGDDTPDVIVGTFDGRIIAIDGETDEVLWQDTFEGAETYGTPAVGYFDDDDVPDVFASFSIGTWPSYSLSRHRAYSGASGERLLALERPESLFSSPLTADLDGDGRDEVLIAHTDFPPDGASTTMLYDIDDESEHTLRETTGFRVSTGLIADLDGDGWLEYISLLVTAGEWVMERRALTSEAGDRISWGAYLGTHFDGVFRPTD